MAHEALQKSTANLKHIIVFSDGDPGAPTPELMQAIVGDRITVSTVLISGHSPPDTMEWMADQGKGRFYNVNSPDDLPQIFIKETAVILKSAIYEDPFQPQVRAASELVRGIGASEYPKLLGYVATTPKPRAETPLWTDKGDPLLAHWQYGLGRAVAFTSDAKARWARIWLNWDKYRQFWSQIGQWSMRRLENADFTTEVAVDKGEGLINVEALDEQGNFRNFLNLQAVVASPKGERQTVRLEQTGPGHYEARFPTKEVGAYLLNLMDIKDGQVRGSQVIGTSVNYSPEFNTVGAEPQPAPAHRRDRRRQDARPDDPGGEPLPARPAEDLPAARPLGVAAQVRHHSVHRWMSACGASRLAATSGCAAMQTSCAAGSSSGAARPRPPEAEESLAALLARRAAGPLAADRSRRRAPARPVPPGKARHPAPAGRRSASLRHRRNQPPRRPKPPKPPAEPAPSTASRLLEAKRRAQKRK